MCLWVSIVLCLYRGFDPAPTHKNPSRLSSPSRPSQKDLIDDLVPFFSLRRCVCFYSSFINSYSILTTFQASDYSPEVRNLLICSRIGSKSSLDILSTIDGIKVFASSASAQQRLAVESISMYRTIRME